MSSTGATPRSGDGPQIFDSFRRWPLVPSSELLQLRHVLLQCMELSGPETSRELSDAASRLLRLITEELERRKLPPDPARPRRLRAESRGPRTPGHARRAHP